MKSGNDIKKQMERIIKLGQRYKPTYNHKRVSQSINIADKYILNLKKHYAMIDSGFISAVIWDKKRNIKTSKEIYAL